MLTIDPVIGYLMVSSFFLLYSGAAYNKWLSLPRFNAVLLSYRLIPAGATPATAILIPSLETAVAVGLWLPSLRAFAAQTGITLLLLYALAIAMNLYRGRRDLDCGCSGPLDRRPIAAWMVVRNLLFAVTLGAVQYPWQSRDWVLVDALTLIGGLVVIVLLSQMTDQLLGRVLPAARRLQGLI
jgi:hypothetical protein